MRLEPGTRVNERLRLLRALRRGGMGAVWVAHHEGLDIEVAVKFISPELAFSGDPIVLTRFRREAQLAAKLVGPHVMRILDHGVTSDDVPYIVMELLRGETVAERFAKKKKLAPADVVRIVSEVAEGLAEAHDLGIVHRDVKPQNLFLTKSRSGQEIAKILDFGIARFDGGDAKSQTASGAVVGTPFYMSPEQLLDGKSPDKSADIWSLAVVTYEALTGRHPFAGETTARTMIAITRAAFERPSSGTSLPGAIDPFFERAFSLDRATRFSSAPALAEALRDALAGAPAPLDEDAPSERADEQTEEFVRSKGLSVPVDASGPSPFASTLGAREIASGPRLAEAVEVRPSSKTAEIVAGDVTGGGSATTISSNGRRVAYVAFAAFLAGGTALWFFVSRRGSSTHDEQTTDAPTSASAAVSHDETPPSHATGIATASAAPDSAPASFFLCPDGVATHCDAKARAWCDEADHAIGCCAPGLAPVGLQRCACAPGGSKDADAVLAGCKAAVKYERASIQVIVRANFPAIRACYERGLERNPKLRGDLGIRFEIGPHGAPGHIGFTNASAPDPDFQDCVLREFAKLRFDPPPDGSLPIKYPLSFTDR